MAPTLAELETKQAELVKKLEDSITSLRSAADQRIAEIEKKWGSDPAAAFKSAADAELKKAQDRLDAVETRLNRPGGGTPEAETKAAEMAQVKAFGAWMRKGVIAPEIKGLATDDDGAGGFLVPAPLKQAIMTKIIEVSPIRANAQVDTISVGDALELPTETGTPAVSWVGERASRPETTAPTFGLQRFPLREQYAMPAATQKMLDDAGFGVEAYLVRRVGDIMGQDENTKFLRGDGVTQPEGILTTPKTETGITDNDTGTSLTLKADDIIDCISQVKTGLSQNGKLFMHRKVIAFVRKLKDSQNQYLWQPSLQTGLPAAFAGYPVIETPDMDDSPTTAGKKVVMFANLRDGYQIVDKPTIGMLRDPYTSKPNVLFYTTRRVGGGVRRGEAISVLTVKA
ncbi:MAG TPA: phage major capsid protein [Candidatus Thermoplasmatota archaeon]|jgi:HK97 family phage major capsid protein|nr:phage major capsid protein [Candidatus Thermoplasmatota archaeon]